MSHTYCSELGEQRGGAVVYAPVFGWVALVVSCLRALECGGQVVSDQDGEIGVAGARVTCRRWAWAAQAFHSRLSGWASS